MPSYVVPDEFAKRFCTWMRIEPRCRSDNFDRGLEARIADPLWMLARQQQMGEFRGEDNGSPIRVKVTYSSNSIDEAFLNGSDQAINLQNQPPLETLVERETVNFEKILTVNSSTVIIKTNWRTRIQIGQQFERFVRRAFEGSPSDAEAIICMYRKPEYFGVENPASGNDTQIDYAARRFLELMAGRALDGRELLIAYNGTVPALPSGLATVDAETRLRTALERLKTWYSELYTELDNGDSSAWVPNKFEYRFTVAASNNAGGRTTLIAPDYKNGDLEWHTLAVQSETSSIINPLIKSCPVLKSIYPIEGSSTSIVKYFSPTRIGFAGKPNERWWTFEKNNVDFGSLDAATTDIVKLMLMEFALVHADDWFMFPLEVPRGSITKIESIEVTNVFGEVMSINPARDVTGNAVDHWEIFALSQHGQVPTAGGGQFLFVPAAIPFREESAAVEEVRFIRDEGANMVFAIEKTVENQVGNSVDGFEAQLERRKREREATLNGTDSASQGTGSADNSLGLPRYRLSSIVPDSWIPFVPVHAGLSGLPGTSSDYKSIRLRQAEMLRNEDSDSPTSIEAMTSILRPASGQILEWVNEESVPRAGVKIQITKQRVRWIDGKTYVWLGRKATTGKGEGGSGLKFDFLKGKKD